MPIYPNYYQQMMNNNFGQPIQSPFMDRMNFMPQYQQNMQQPQVPSTNQPMNVMGKVVDSIDVVKAADVPMDGNMYYFPKADGTEIFGKQWLVNGQTRILTFKPVLEQEPNTLLPNSEKIKIGLSDEVTDTFMKRFDDIEKRLDDFIAKSANKTSPRTKREDGAE